MKFGYFCNTTNWNKKPYSQILDEAREITTYCDTKNWNDCFSSILSRMINSALALNLFWPSYP